MRLFFGTLFLVLSGGILMAQTSVDNRTNDRAYLGISTKPVSKEKAALFDLPNSGGSMLDDQEAENAFLGIYSEAISKTKAHKLGFDNSYGSYVTGVIPNTAAERAQIQPFDYIYGVDEYRTGEGQELTHILQKYAPGDGGTIHFVRKGQSRQVKVTFGSREQTREIEKDKCEAPFLGVQASHTYVEKTGVSVDIIANSTAASLGMQNGDLITRINGYPMIDWTDIRTAIENMEVGETIKVVWFRNGGEMSDSKPILSYCDTKTNQIVYKEKTRTVPPVWTPRSPEPLDLANVEVVVSDVNREEASEMKSRYGIDLNLENSVGMNSIRIVTYPDKGVFQLSFNLPNRGQTTVRIYNNAGRPIYIYDIGTFSGKFSDDVDLSQNGEGTYYLHVQQNEKSVSKRLLVQKG